mmetsp:Transcript_10781/g.23445  ORF Transcript_10781/g.23445 Transcript_10781/m.23445 type:complete len:290 (+) Transcript_10781:6363-7232(+)
MSVTAPALLSTAIVKESAVTAVTMCSPVMVISSKDRKSPTMKPCPSEVSTAGLDMETPRTSREIPEVNRSTRITSVFQDCHMALGAWAKVRPKFMSLVYIWSDPALTAKGSTMVTTAWVMDSPREVTFTRVASGALRKISVANSHLCPESRASTRSAETSTLGLKCSAVSKCSIDSICLSEMNSASLTHIVQSGQALQSLVPPRRHKAISSTNRASVSTQVVKSGQAAIPRQTRLRRTAVSRWTCQGYHMWLWASTSYPFTYAPSASVTCGLPAPKVTPQVSASPKAFT